jgi:hypothetical protein
VGAGPDVVSCFANFSTNQATGLYPKASASIRNQPTTVQPMRKLKRPIRPTVPSIGLPFFDRYHAIRVGAKYRSQPVRALKGPTEDLLCGGPSQNFQMRAK